MRPVPRLVVSTLVLALAAPAGPALAASRRAPAVILDGDIKSRLNMDCPLLDATALDCRRGKIETVADDYRRLARRNQSEADRAAAFTSLSVTAFLIGATSGAAATTQSAWSFGAATPLVVNDLRAPDHRGMLYMTAARVLNGITDRYGRLNRAMAFLATFDRRPPADDIARSCSALRDAQAAMGRVNEDSRRTTVLAALEATIGRCDAAARMSRALAVYRRTVDLEQQRLPERIAGDGQQVVGRVEELDRSLRASPFEAFRTTAAAPFLTVGAVLKGDASPFEGRHDPRDGKDYELVVGAPPVLPELPDELAAEPTLTPAVTQALKELRDGQPKPRRAAFIAATAALESVAGSLPGQIQDLNAERAAAALVAVIDAERTVSLDPRRPVAAAK